MGITSEDKRKAQSAARASAPNGLLHVAVSVGPNCRQPVEGRLEVQQNAVR